LEELRVLFSVPQHSDGYLHFTGVGNSVPGQMIKVASVVEVYINDKGPLSCDYERPYYPTTLSTGKMPII
jgi:hypothetical protein